jgi:hypothetical protein
LHAPRRGLYLEFGVASGQSINFIAARVPRSQTVHGFDSFEGLPEQWRPGYNAGLFDLQGALPQVAENVQLHPGWFKESLPQFLGGLSGRRTADGDDVVAFLHIDCDIYSSTALVLEALRSRIVAGSVIVFDEW